MLKDQKHRNEQNGTKFPDEYSILSGIKKETPFTVPEGYFDELPNVISNRILRPEKKNFFFSLYNFRQNPGYAIGLIAALLLIFVMVYLSRDHRTDQNLQITGISIELLIEEEPGLIDFSYDYFFYETWISLSEEDLSEDVFSDFPSDPDLNDETIIDYLSEEDVNIDLFYNL